MNNNLILRALTSPYNDITKASVLSHADVDGNFIFLKGNVIYTAITDNGIVTLKKYNGEDIIFSGGTSNGNLTDVYWTSGTTGDYSIKANNDSGLDSIGDYSISYGIYGLAKGEASHASGKGDINSEPSPGVYNHVISDGIASFTHQFVGEVNSELNVVAPLDGCGSFGDYSAILGGSNNLILSGLSSVILGGDVNTLFGDNNLRSGIVSGYKNGIVNTWNGLIIGGRENGVVFGDNSVIIGGKNNVIDAYFYYNEPNSFIAGGQNNVIQTGGLDTQESGAIIGGKYNKINGNNQYVGIYNSFSSTATSQDTSTIIGSYESTIYDYLDDLSSHNNSILNSSNSNIIGYGNSNDIILGGSNNSINQSTISSVQPNYSIVINGDSNRIYDTDTATILNGYSNAISGDSKQSSIINGQFHNINSSQFSAIIGGNSNEMTDTYGSAIIGGSNNGILSDNNPSFTRYYNAILGGTGNTIDNGELCFIMGGYQNIIPYGTVGSVILGGDSITANSNNTVFVQRLNVKYVQNDNLTTKILTIDNNGLVKYRNVSSISGGTGSSGTTIDLYWASGTTGNYSVKANNGSTTDATNDYAFAINKDNLASGLYSLAGGFGSEAKAESSVALGYDTEAFGKYSFAGGDRSKSSGETSFVWSKQSTAFGNRTVVLGGSGIAGYNSDTVYVPYLSVMSASTDNSLSNILVKNSNGEIKLKELNSFYTGITSISVGSISATTYNNLPTSVTGFTNTPISYTGSNGSISFVTNNGNVVTMSGLVDTRVTGFTYDDKNTFTIKQSNGDFSRTFNTMSGLTVNGNITFTGQSNNPIYSANSGTFSGGTYKVQLDFNNSAIQTVTLSGNTEFLNPLNIKNGAIYTLILKQPSAGNCNVSWFTNTFKWESGNLPSVTTNPNAVDLITFISDGTNLYGIIAKNFS